MFKVSKWVLSLAISLWRFESPSRFQLLKWEFTWECGVHSLTLSYTPRSMKCDSRASLLARTLQALALVASLRLGLRQMWFCRWWWGVHCKRLGGYMRLTWNSSWWSTWGGPCWAFHLILSYDYVNNDNHLEMVVGSNNSWWVPPWKIFHNI